MFIKKSFIFACLTVIFFQPLFAQVTRKQAEENPLSTIIYLLSTTDKDSKEDQKVCLAKSLANVGRFNQMEDVANMVEKESYVDEHFVVLVNDLISKGKTKEAAKFLAFLIVKFESDEDKLQMTLRPLVRLGKDNEALQIVSKFDDSDKIDGSFELANVYLELGRNEKALSVIESFKRLVEQSKYDEEKAELGLIYAKLGKESEALRFLQESLKNLKWKTGKPEYDEARIIDKVVEIYRVLGKNDQANQLLAKQGLAEEPRNLIQIGENYLSKGDSVKANQLFESVLSKLNPNEYSDVFDLQRLIEIHLKLGEIEKAEQLTKSLTSSNYTQQGLLLKIADFYIKQKNTAKALEILNFALRKTNKIDISEAESGQLSTSNKWDQARYQSQIAIRFIDMHLDKRALELISQLKKPYLRALILTEFVSLNKKRIPRQKLNSYLEQALSFLRQKKIDIFDSKRFDVYAIVARKFAEIGLKEESTVVFAETLSELDKKVIENGSDSGLLYAMCNIGIEFENSKIKTSKKLKESLRNIISNWENDLY